MLQNYLEIVESPRDLTTIVKKLDRNAYQTPEDFDRDCRLIFSNSRLFNTDVRSKVNNSTIFAVCSNLTVYENMLYLC